MGGNVKKPNPAVVPKAGPAVKANKGGPGVTAVKSGPPVKGGKGGPTGTPPKGGDKGGSISGAAGVVNVQLSFGAAQDLLLALSAAMGFVCAKGKKPKGKK